MKHSAPINTILKRQREANKSVRTYSLQHTVQIAQIAKAVESSKTSALTNHLLIPMPRTL